MREHTVIPMSFGTVFRSDDDVTELLRSTYRGVQRRARQDAGQDRVRPQGAVGPRQGRRELEARERRDPAPEGRDLRRRRARPTSRACSTAGSIEAALQSRSERYVADIHDALATSSVASRSNKPIGDHMIMNAAFLVVARQEQAFDERVKDDRRRYDKLTFKYTGPVAALQLREHQAEAGTGAHVELQIG